MKATLYFKQGSSDKIYQCQIVPEGDGYLVNFQYGRRGSTLTTGTKTAAPVTHDDAVTIFEKLVREKTAKGYTPGEAGTPYTEGDKADRVTGLAVQLLNSIDEADLDHYLTSPDYVLQEKLDGKRMLLRYDERLDVAVTAINRTGLTCGAPDNILNALSKVAVGGAWSTLILDGECIGDRFFVFDILELNGINQRHKSYIDRHRQLKVLDYGAAITIVPVYSENKDTVLRAMYKGGREGVVFKSRAAPYTPGRPNSGGTQFKYKFQAEATCEVLKIHSSKRSFEVGVRDEEGELTFIGNVTVPANKEFPKVGDQVEIRYLYCFPGGCLFQPFFKGVRDDKTEADFHYRLKFKNQEVQS